MNRVEFNDLTGIEMSRIEWGMAEEVQKYYKQFEDIDVFIAFCHKYEATGIELYYEPIRVYKKAKTRKETLYSQIIRSEADLSKVRREYELASNFLATIEETNSCTDEA